MLEKLGDTIGVASSERLKLLESRSADIFCTVISDFNKILSQQRKI
jgi:hypothetical protein